MLIALHAALHAGYGAAWAHVPARAPGRWPLCVALYLDLLLLAPLVAYQARLWPAYAFSYALDPLLSPAPYAWISLGCLGVLLAMPLALALSFSLTALARRQARPWLSVMPLVAAAAVAATVCLATWEELRSIADFNAYWNGGGTPAWHHVHVLLLLAAYAAGAAAMGACRLRRAAPAA